MKRPVVVSACLVGARCRYDGALRPRPLPDVGQPLVPVCPEMAAGMGCPRPAIERTAAGRIRVVDTGEDVTEALARACDVLLDAARAWGATGAWLAEGSPSCGVRRTWCDGERATGPGLFAERLAAAGISVEGIE